MAKAQGKKAAAAGSKNAAKKVSARVKSAPKAAKKKVAAKKPVKPAPKKPAPKKPAPKKPAPKKPAPKAKAAPKPSKPVKKELKKQLKKRLKKPVKKVAKAAAKAVKAVARKVVAKVTAKAVAKPAAKPAAKKPVAKTAAKPPAKPAAKAEKAAPKVKAVKPAPAPAPVAPNVPAVPKAAKPEPEKKRGRRARPRVLSSGAPAASWLSSEKPRPASFIAAPARAEAPSAVAAPPASSDRLIREDDLAHPAVRTVPVRIDVEQGAGRFYVIANPMEVTVRVSEGIEWDFRYLGGADVNVEEIVIELEKPSPFAQAVFRTRKPGGARPHRQMSGGALPAAAGKRMQYTVRAINQFKTELANTKVFLNVTA